MSLLTRHINFLERFTKALLKTEVRAGLPLVVALLVISACSNDPAKAQRIAVDEVGFRPQDSKVAFFDGPGLEDDHFVVIDSRTSKAVFKGHLGHRRDKSLITGQANFILDFTELNKSGTYYISIPRRDVRSVDFQISADVYDGVVKKAAESFYYQRCGTSVDIGTKWTHPACHLDDAVFFSNPQKHKDVRGGWHDAGDYGKYSVNTAVSLAFLLYLYDQSPKAFSDGQLDIPGRGNGTPDLLDQAKWALRWLMKMQRSDGAVYHKVQKKKWTGEYLPQNDPDRRYIFGVSSAATADFAAVASLGARIFKRFNPRLSDRLAEAALKAWDFLEEHPSIFPAGGFQNPKGVKGGEYGDKDDSDERLWASVELYRLTKEKKYQAYFAKHYNLSDSFTSSPVSWKNVSDFACAAYLHISDNRQNHRVRRALTQKLLNYANRLVNRAATHDYRVVLKKDEYYWGSNSVAMGYAFDLIQAYVLSGEERYEETALDQLHYILGRNALRQSFVTGVGEKPVQHPYYQFSIKSSITEAVPGLVVGGPNSHNQLHDRPLSEYPAQNYEDKTKNYMVNEPAINYTAPLVYLSGFFSDMNPRSISQNQDE